MNTKVKNINYVKLAKAGKYPLVTDKVKGFNLTLGVNSSAVRERMSASEFRNSLPFSDLTPSGHNASESAFVSPGLDMVLAEASSRVQIPDHGGIWTVIDSVFLDEGLTHILISSDGFVEAFGGNRIVNHQQRFGGKLVPPHGMKPFENIQKGDTFEQGTVLLTTAPYGVLQYGCNANIVTSTDPRTVEDGWVVSESFAKGKTTRSIQKFEIELSPHDTIWLDDYPIPKVGTRIKPGGIVFAYRKGDLIAAAKNKVYSKLSQDDITYRNVLPVEGVVSEVSILISDIASGQFRHCKLSDQEVIQDLLPTRTAHRDRYLALLHNPLFKDNKAKLGENLRVLLTKASVIANKKSIVVPKTRSRRGTTITIYLESLVPLHPGSKMATTIGCKGVIVDILPDNEMPLDSDGVRADVMIGGNVRFKRNIPTDDILSMQGAIVYRSKLKVLKALNIGHNETREVMKNLMDKASKAQWEEAIGIYSRMLSVMSAPHQADFDALSIEERQQYLEEMLLYGLYTCIRPVAIAMENNHRNILNNPDVGEFLPKYEQLTIVNPYDNKPVKSPTKSFIGNLYVFPQVYDSYSLSATGSCSTYPTGTIASRPSDILKNNAPLRESVTILFGADEQTQVPLGMDLDLLAKLNFLVSDRDTIADNIKANLKDGGMKDYPKLEEAKTPALQLLTHLMSHLGGIGFWTSDRGKPPLMEEVKIKL